ncbi:MAG: trehalose-6-phosphate synthase [Chloroflexi bacterium]|nr:trehalose-6-phosphate synthase [Chloroflexota bacterium]
MDPRPRIVLANRAFVDHTTPPGGGTAPGMPPGGLLAALRPLIDPWDGAEGTTWIGAGRGACDRSWTDERGYEFVPTPRGPLRHRRIYLDNPTWQGHYGAVANSFLWPLVHLVRRPFPLVTDYYPLPATPSDGQWDAYRWVNELFAAAAVEEAPGQTCWVHDYQLALVPAFLRRYGFRGRVGFFLHTPYPDVTTAFSVLEPRGIDLFREWTQGILSADVVGVQTAGDRDRLLEAARRFEYPGALSRVLVCPVGIDCDDVSAVAETGELPVAMARIADPSLPLVVGLERADFTKGIPERMRSVARLLDSGSRFNYVGVAAPTRRGVHSYTRFDSNLRAAAGIAEAAGRRAGVSVIHYEEALGWRDVVALQREADVVFTSSLADGMNLVPLQAAIAQAQRPPAERAVLIAGMDAGVASAFPGFQADGLTLVDPLDATSMDTTLEAALRGEPGRVSERLIGDVRRQDARAWASAFLSELEGVRC